MRLRGLIGLLSAVGAYYLLITVSEAGFRLIGAPHAATTWGAVGLIAGPIFGAAGGAWRHWQGTGRALAVAVLAASLIAEGVVFGELRLGDIGGILLLVEVAIGLVVPFALLRPGERLIGYCGDGSPGAGDRVGNRADLRPRAVRRRPVLATVRRGTEGSLRRRTSALKFAFSACASPPLRSAS